MRDRLLLPLPDYVRIYQVIYSTLEASGIALTHRACLFFAFAGVLILREKYKLPATVSAGCMALMVEDNSTTVVYGRQEDGFVEYDRESFHAWIECDGWLIDFMAPIMGTAVRQDGRDWIIPRKMLQKRLDLAKPSLAELARSGDFFIEHDRALADSLIDRQPVQFHDLLNICSTWFRRPPKKLESLSMGDSQAGVRKLVLCAPSVSGVW